VIQREKGEFRLRAKRVDPILIDKLVAALREPIIPKPNTQNLGMTPDWLKENAVPAVQKHAPFSFDSAAPNQKELFVRSFNDPAVIERALDSLFGFMMFDDYPRAAVRVLFEDGTALEASSHSYYQFMLPWQMNGDVPVTYNANISRAIAALMPKSTVNRDRLVGQGFEVALAEVVMRHIKDEWELLDAENRAGEALASLRAAYSVQAAKINSYHSQEYGIEWGRDKPTETNLHVTLRKPGFPPNVTVALVLKLANGKVEGVGNFLHTGAQYETHALSIPWLSRYIQDHPAVPVRISYVHNASFGEKAMRAFAADMEAIGKKDKIPRVRRSQREITLLIIGRTYSESYWLILPDSSMLLWQYGGPSGLLKWRPEDFPVRDCSAYQGVLGGCAGAEISAAGEPVKNYAAIDHCAMPGAEAHLPVNENESSFPVHKDGKGGFIDRTGVVVIPLRFDTVGEFSEGLAPAECAGRWGFINRLGEWVIWPKFVWAYGFSQGLARVQVGGVALGPGSRWGFVNRRGEIVIEPVYGELMGVGEESQGFREGLAMVQVDWKWGFIDTAGKLAIPPQFKYAYHFYEGLAAVSADGDKWGYINKQGNWAIPPRFKWASLFSEGLAPVDEDGVCKFIDPTGSVVLSPPMPREEKDCAAIWGHFNGGLSRWRFGKKFGYIDRAGRTVIPPRFDLTDGFAEGFAKVFLDGKWAYIDKTGTRVVPPQEWHHVDDFRNGLAHVVTPDGKHGYIDKSGKYVWQPARQSRD
jgi:hypothetical protein